MYIDLLYIFAILKKVGEIYTNTYAQKRDFWPYNKKT